MNIPATAVLALGLAAPVRAQSPLLSSLELPPAPVPMSAAPTAATAAAPQAATLIPPSSWDGLKAPDPRVLGILAARLPGLNTAMVREVPYELADGILSQAVARGLSALDVFTDPGLMGSRVYYIPAGVLAQMDQNYDLKSIFLVRGKTDKGNPFYMQGLVMGNGRMDILYNLTEFTFVHPIFTDYGGKYTLQSRVGQPIEGPGVARIEGVQGPLNAEIRKFVKLSPNRVKVVTSILDSESPLYPVARR